MLVGDLDGSTLGLATPGTIWIDRDAAGFGWFLDATPGDDAEFAAGMAPGGIDLFSVVAHELGHLLGLEHAHEDDHTDALMAESLAPGTRRSPPVRELAAEATVEVVVTVPRPGLPADPHPTALDHLVAEDEMMLVELAREPIEDGGMTQIAFAEPPVEVRVPSGSGSRIKPRHRLSAVIHTAEHPKRRRPSQGERSGRPGGHQAHAAGRPSTG